MTKGEPLGRIPLDPSVCSGKSCIRGRRTRVPPLLDLPADGRTIRQVSDGYPGVAEADVLACIACCAEMSRERCVEVRP